MSDYDIKEFVEKHCTGRQYDSCTNSPCEYSSPYGCQHPLHPKRKSQTAPDDNDYDYFTRERIQEIRTLGADVQIVGSHLIARLPAAYASPVVSAQLMYLIECAAWNDLASDPKIYWDDTALVIEAWAD